MRSLDSPIPYGRSYGLDLLRAVAILAVMAFHLIQVLPESLYPVARFCWMGVDLFFVLSGYLIGSQLLKPYLSGGAPSLLDFYRRRAYRILPAYLVVVLLYFTVPVWRESPGISPLWQFLTFTENLLIDYPTHHAFSHAWSLCVEEHFYLVLPLLVLGMMRRPSFKKTLALLIATALLGMAIRAFVLVHILQPLGVDDSVIPYFERIYYPTYTHLDGLLVGVMLALVRTFRPRWWASAMQRGHSATIAGLLLLAMAVWLFKDRLESVTGVSAWGTVIGFPVLSTGLGLLVLSSLSTNGALARLRFPGARLLATLAFSLYLTHKEVVHLDQIYLPSLTQHPGFVATSLYAITCLAAAAVLYLAVERPFMLLRDRKFRARSFVVEEQMRNEPAL